MTRVALWRALAVAAALSAGATGPAAAQRYEAILTEHGNRHAIGVLRLDAGRKIQVVSARPRWAGLLRQIADEVNAEETLHIDVPPPAGARPYDDVTRPIPRTDPRFRDALRQHLQQYYDVTLR